ncbi:hypothetical protein DICVIV_01861 [Dictyocaulus viviparus]|uniref:Uncharacterized protein n=1 Tax=Dictyocaulus viviparus TaxID=29172 RepID=A0A0D8Y5F8_DICVI|nr:hypothetical protein DICVIV_01861 [Dictyocaulus viviparus]
MNEEMGTCKVVEGNIECFYKATVVLVLTKFIFEKQIEILNSKCGLLVSNTESDEFILANCKIHGQ